MQKTMKSSLGNFELSTPRDRESSFEPEIVKKRQTTLPGDLDQRIIAMYAHGMSYRDITSELHELLGLEFSEATISSITDKVLPLMEEWRNRALESVYPFVWLDAIHFKIREDGKIINKAIYCILGVNQEGQKDLLGLYISENEGARFWLQVLTQLKNRGIEDIFIACIDNLKGFAEGIEAVFPKTEVQLCIVHQVRNSLKYVSYKDQKEFVVDMQKIYRSSTKDSAEVHLEGLAAKWGKKYPVVVTSWRNNWDRLSQFFLFSNSIRKVIYTTNTIEGFHRQLRKYTKSKSVFPNDKAILKLLYLIQERITKKWKRPILSWPDTITELSIIFEGRLKLKF
jgi:transposase-like protein